jgi:1-deoxy-D-xylulose 5-phosphate reductoisomerase
MKKILILGSTGSIGRAALDVIANERDAFEIVGLACKENVRLLNSQIEKFRPGFVCVYDEPVMGEVKFDKKRLLAGMSGIQELINMDVDMVVNALPGSIGLEPSLEALRKGRTLALANKESMVMAGRIISGLSKENGSRLIPVDSEHSALYQLLKGFPREEMATLMITASGGPFREHKREQLEQVSPAEALNHPTWKMGNKITLDSATLMNKGLEVIEARWLFDLEPSRIKVLVHPESIIHGMVEMVDGSLISYMAYPDMKIPIAYALNEEKRHPLPFSKLNLEDVCTLTFSLPDTERFPSLRLAFEALEMGDSALVALNISNEVASAAFVEGRIRFTQIPLIIEETILNHPVVKTIEDVETLWEVHAWSKAYAEAKLRSIHANT